MDDFSYLRRLIDELISVDASVREGALASLRQMERESLFHALDSMLQPPKGKVFRAANAMVHVFPDRGFARILPLLQHPEASVRHAICGLLGNLGGERVVDPLVQVLLHDTNSENRSLAAFSLSKTGSPRALLALRQAASHDKGVDDDGWTVGHAAEEAIHYIESHGDPDAEPKR